MNSSDYLKFKNHQHYSQLSGAGRRRYWKLVQQGVSLDQAEVIAFKRWSDLRREGKLETGKKIKISLLDNDCLDEEQSGDANDFLTPTADNENCSDANIIPSNSVAKSKLILLAEIHDINLMSSQQIDMVHKSLLNEIAKLEDGTGPKFSEFSPQAGWILITCEDYFSRDWLMQVIPKIKPWPSADLFVHVRDEKVAATTYLPSSEADNIELALKLIQVQNKKINTEKWQVVYKREYEGGYVVTFRLDDRSIVTLTRMNFKASFGFKNIFFKMLPYLQTNNEDIANYEDSTTVIDKKAIVTSSNEEEILTPQADSTSGCINNETESNQFEQEETKVANCEPRSPGSLNNEIDKETQLNQSEQLKF